MSRSSSALFALALLWLPIQAAGQIISVRHGPIPRDIANHWVIVRFTNDQQQPDAAAFRDGSRIGLGQDTRLMYLAARRAAKK